jgi:LysR family glycine cleavage system transcriptional activator
MEEKNCIMRADTPLKAIACFDAVMRTGSAKLAAEVLFVTPGAVGQQLRKLEQWLGVALFVRSVRKLQPTDEALRYWQQVRPALEQIDEASASLQGTGALQVSLSMPPGFANTWFARRMADLSHALPDLQLRINAAEETVDVVTGPYDLAVRHFDGKTDRLHASLLLRDEVSVFCSPQYRDRLPLRVVGDLQQATLLHISSHANWSRWLADAGVIAGGKKSGLRFDQSELAIDAARRGQGVVLTNPWLVEDDLEQGRLVQVFPKQLRTGKGYYLVHAREKTLSPSAQQLHDWIVSMSEQCVSVRANSSEGSAV